jgi:hypothetical protein
MPALFSLVMNFYCNLDDSHLTVMPGESDKAFAPDTSSDVASAATIGEATEAQTKARTTAKRMFDL